MLNISPGESQVMEALWSQGPLTNEDLTVQVGAANGWADGTIRTLVHRLLRKKAIEGAKVDGRYVYRPLLARADYVQTESQGLLDRLFGGRVTPLVHHFAEHGALTPDELAKLKALIAEVERKHG